MSYKPSDAYTKVFTTSSPTTGAATNADSLPAATANRNGTDDGSFTLVVANLDTGRYKITGTIPSGYASGDVLNVSIAATVGGVAAKAIVDTQILDSKRTGDSLNINLAQTGISPRALDAVADGALTVGDALVAALAMAAGKQTVSGTSYTVKTPSTGTVIRTFTLDSGTAPTTRT